MKTKQILTATVAGLLAISALAAPKMKMTTEIPEAFTAPDSVKTSIGTLRYFDGVPSEKSTQAIYDFLDTSRAVNVYLNSIPALSVNALREGQAAMGADTCNKICIWDSLMDSKTILLTGNTSTMYAVGFLDLLKDGPLILYFYPADFTPGCTKEACSIRDIHNDIQSVGLRVAGVGRLGPRVRARVGEAVEDVLRQPRDVIVAAVR